MKKTGRKPKSQETSEADFADCIKKYGMRGTARKLGIGLSAVFKRRARLENKYHVAIAAPDNQSPRPTQYPQRHQIKITDGIVLVCGDAHYWPGPPSLMHRAFVAFCKEFKPKAVVHVGDVLDAPTISRYTPIGWESRPLLADEVETAKERLWEIEEATFRIPKVWTLGNHDARFETRLAHVAPEYAKIHGVHLRDHFPQWVPCWSCWINDDLVIKHRFKSGHYAPFQATLWAGKSLVTGHLHSAKVMPLTDYNGTRYGVDVGCIAETDHKAFVDYTEDNPKNWRSAFGVFTFKDGKLLLPELVLKWDANRIQFRGAVFAP